MLFLKKTPFNKDVTSNHNAPNSSTLDRTKLTGKLKDLLLKKNGIFKIFVY